MTCFFTGEIKWSWWLHPCVHKFIFAESRFVAALCLKADLKAFTGCGYAEGRMEGWDHLLD